MFERLLQNWLPSGLPFEPGNPQDALAQLPKRAAVYALSGADPAAEPYVGRTPNLHARLNKLLRPAVRQTRRLELAARVARIGWRETGSEFESLLLQFGLLEGIYGPKALTRMHLRMPAFIRFHGGNRYPRLTVTQRVNTREPGWLYGPFPSRAAAERYVDELLKLFLLRRCQEDLSPDPSHPGCVYSEMKMCLAPCYRGCTDERYAEEARAVSGFLATRGEDRLVTLRADRDQASERMDFEQAAALHAQAAKVEAARGLAAELVRPLRELRAAILQPAAEAGEVAVFLYDGGRMSGPVPFSTVGMRIQNEQSGSSSLYAQPMAVEAVPEVEGGQKRVPETEEGSSPVPAESGAAAARARRETRNLLETRLDGVMERLEAAARESGQVADGFSATLSQGHLSLLARWYYRPATKRAGEIFFPDGAGAWPARAILRGIGRVAAGSAGQPSLSG